MLTDPGAGRVPDDEPWERGVTQAREHNVHTRLVTEEGTGSGLWESVAQIPVGLIREWGGLHKQKIPSVVAQVHKFCILSEWILHSGAAACSNSVGGYEIDKRFTGSANKKREKGILSNASTFLIRSCAAGAGKETDGPS